MKNGCTPEALADVVYHLGHLSAGDHECPGEGACILEAVSICDGVDWTDDPNALDRPDIRPLNDGPWTSDEVRTEQMMRLAPLLAAWPAWGKPRRLDYLRRVVIRTVRELLPIALRDRHLPDRAKECEHVTTLAAAEGAAAAAYTASADRKVIYAAQSACAAARHVEHGVVKWAARSAAETSVDAVDSSEAVAADATLTLAVSIWAEETA